MTATPDVVAAAQAQVELGFAAFALLANAKVPVTSHGFKNATTKPDWIETQLQAPPAGNYGIVWPEDAPPVVGFDLDDGGGADRPWQDRLLDLIARLGPLPATKSTTTPSGGRHAWYRWPEDVPIPPGDELFGFTVRWPGRGYFVGPGSSIDGRPYVAGNVADIAALPDAWVDAAVLEHGHQRDLTPGQITITGSFELPDRIPSGRRYATVRDYVASRYNAGLDMAELWELVRTQVAPRFEQPKTEADLRGDFERVVAKMAERLGPPARVPGPVVVAVPLTPEQLSASSIDAADLLELDIPPLEFVVPDLIPEGTTILAGPPKLGKSCLVYQIAVEVALGGEILGRDIAQGDVLYLALEDGKRRGQTRLRAALGRRVMPRGRLEVRWSCSKLGAGLEEEILAWLDSHPQARLVAVDTLQKVRARGDARRNAYEVDVEDLGRLQNLFRDRAVGLLVVHHSKKDAGDDFLASVSGTYGITGSADTTLVIQRKRLETYGKLVVTGRDIEELEQAVQFLDGQWTVAPDQLPEATFEQRRVYRAIEQHGPIFAAGIADVIYGKLPPDSDEEARAQRDRDRDAIQKLVNKLSDTGAIARSETERGWVTTAVRIIVGAGSEHEPVDSAPSAPLAHAGARTGVPTPSTPSAPREEGIEGAEGRGTRVTRAGAHTREDATPELTVVRTETTDLVCHFYADHRSVHRFVGGRWICDICSPVEAQQ